MLTFRNPDAVRCLYENLGKLFYAVAAADKMIHKEEVEALNEIVEKEWIPIEDSRDEYGTDLGFQIEVIFDWFAENEFSAEAAFEKFRVFKEEHDYLFDKDLKLLIWKTAEKIAFAFADRSKPEILILSRLGLLLQLPILRAVNRQDDEPRLLQ